ncbi:MAG TPA: serine hydrolase, partial [Noviherbaspirillum sp.]|nr:serine hydrolase [Noviherbaspirillum sp.]
VIEITADDIDRLKNSSSRLRVGTRMTRAEALHLSLMSSENRAASALARHYPGGTPAFVAAMNARARSLGMRNTRFVESTGLSSENVASAHDLTRLAVAAYRHPLIRDYSTHPRHAIAAAGGHQLQYMNSNRLVDHPDWDIGLQKTGYISEAGRCLLMQARVDGRPVVMVFLDSRGKDSRLGDAARVRKWLETAEQTTMTTASARSSCFSAPPGA